MDECGSAADAFDLHKIGDFSMSFKLSLFPVNHDMPRRLLERISCETVGINAAKSLPDTGIVVEVGNVVSAGWSFTTQPLSTSLLATISIIM